MRLDTPARIEFERSTGFSLGWQPTLFTLALGAEMPFRSGMGVGCNMAFRRDALDEVGPFDEALDTGRPLPGGGDLDMMIRMVVAGGVFFEPSAVVFHDHRHDWSALRYQFYTWGKGWAVVLDKWYRAESAYRPRIRRVSKAMVRSLGLASSRGHSALAATADGIADGSALALWSAGWVATTALSNGSRRAVRLSTRLWPPAARNELRPAAESSLQTVHHGVITTAMPYKPCRTP